jgi:hypothetical protein
MLSTLSWVLTEQGRVAEAETLSRAALEIFDAIGHNPNSLAYVRAQSNLRHIVSTAPVR